MLGSYFDFARAEGSIKTTMASHNGLILYLTDFQGLIDFDMVVHANKTRGVSRPPGHYCRNSSMHERSFGIH